MHQGEEDRACEIPMTRIDDAVRRILRVKFRAGMFEAGKPSTRGVAGRFDLLGSAEHRAIALTDDHLLRKKNHYSS